jgi:UDP-N-acetyl-D-galactosamine dehydrogenase
VVDVYKELQEFGLQVEVYDPLANAYQIHKEYGIELIQDPNLNDYEVILLAVAHDDFKDLQIKTAPNKVVYDLKGILPRINVDKRL